MAQERWIEASAQERRRQVRSINGDLTINSISVPPPISFPNRQNSLHIPPPAKPFSSFSAKPQSPPCFTSFTSLFKQPPPPMVLDKGILPLPPNLKPLPAFDGEWIPVVRRKKARIHRSAPPLERSSITVKKRRCFYCGDYSHMAKECKIVSFLCFRCKEVGHTFSSCPLTYKPSARATPIFSLPQAVRDNIHQLPSFAIFTLKAGNPSILELKEMLEYNYNVKDWEEKIISASMGTLLIEFPSSELLNIATSTPYVDMGSFGGSFSKWNERKGLHVFTEPVFVWVQISSLPFYLWDTGFFSQLFKGIGQVHTCSRDILHKEEARDCKVLLKVKCRQDIPPSIPFRYISPSSGCS